MRKIKKGFPPRTRTDQCIKLCNDEGGGWIYYNHLFVVKEMIVGVERMNELFM